MTPLARLRLETRIAIDAALLADASRSDRAIARELGANRGTVTARRHQLVSAGRLVKLARRTGGDGKTYPAVCRSRMPRVSRLRRVTRELDRLLVECCTVDFAAECRAAGLSERGAFQAAIIRLAARADRLRHGGRGATG